MADPGLVAAFLVGAFVGVLLVPFTVGVWLWWSEVKSAVREGTPLDGEAMERAKRREP